MATDASHGPVHERLANAIVIELEIAEALASVARAFDQADGIAEVERLRIVVREHVAALAAPGLAPGGHSLDEPVATESGSRPTQAISFAEQGFAAATQAYAELYTTARVLYEPEVCDLAERHLAHHVEGLQVMAGLLPGALARELNADGLFCRCICPACSIGACGCVRNSIVTIADAWGGPACRPVTVWSFSRRPGPAASWPQPASTSATASLPSTARWCTRMPSCRPPFERIRSARRLGYRSSARPASWSRSRSDM